MSSKNNKIKIVGALILMFILASTFWMMNRKVVPNDFNYSAWFAAIRQGDLAYVNKFINNRLPATLEQKNGWSSLRLAIRFRHFKIAQILIKNGADVNEAISPFGPLIELAVKLDDNAFVRLLIAQGADLNTKNKTGNSPIANAIARNNYIIIAELAAKNKQAKSTWDAWPQKITFSKTYEAIKKGKHIKYSSREVFGRFCYVQGRIAELSGAHKQAEEYYKRGSRNYNFMSRYRLLTMYLNSKLSIYNVSKASWLESTKKERKHPYLRNVEFYHQEMTHFNSRAAKWLLKSYSYYHKKTYDLSIKDLISVEAKKGDPLFQTAWALNQKEYFPKHLDKERNNTRRQWLIKAAKQNHAFAAKLLAEDFLDGLHGTKQNTNKAMDWFKIAGANGYPGIFNRVANYYEEGNRYKKIPKDLNKAIHWLKLGVKYKDPIVTLKVANALATGKLAYKIDYNRAFNLYNRFADKYNLEKTQIVERAIATAIEKNQLPQIKIWLNRTKSNKKLFNQTWLKVLQKGKLEQIKYFVQEGADVNYDFQPYTPINIAVQNNNLELIKFLITQGAKIATKRKNKIKIESPLYYATKNKNEEIIRFLIKQGVDVNQGINNTPLINVIQFKDLKLIKLLILLGADINHKNRMGQTPYDAAKITGEYEIEKMVLINKNIKMDKSIHKTELERILATEKKHLQYRAWKAGKLMIRLDGTGSPLKNQNEKYQKSPWSCIQDKMSHLMWTVKDSSIQLHGRGFLLAIAGSKVSCSDKLPCTTVEYLKKINELKYCGHNDWRLPTQTELKSLAYPHASKSFPFWPGYALWTADEKNKNSHMITWASGFLGKKIPYISMPSVAVAILVRGKNEMPDYRSDAFFNTIRVQGNNISLDRSQPDKTP